jgi:hypothetical protein
MTKLLAAVIGEFKDIHRQQPYNMQRFELGLMNWPS